MTNIKDAALSYYYLQGDLYDYQSLLNAIKQVDVVFSTVPRSHLAEQDNIISAIKEAGNVKVCFFLLLGIYIVLIFYGFFSNI